jgi:amylovoran biosynthesis glycosyltransferase AmsE
MHYSYNEINSMAPSCETSVILPVYNGDNASDFSEALHSILNQTYRDFELVIVVDGPVSETISEILKFNEFKDRKIKILRLLENSGLATALNLGLKYCEGQYIIRCDADDINLPDRFEILLREFSRLNADVIGSQIVEFSTGEEGRFHKHVPLRHEEIKSFALYRNPMNHMSVIFRKSAVLAVGGYPDILLKEDYALWLKMINMGFIFANLPEILVNARVNSQFFSRRGGRLHVVSEVQLLRLKLQLSVWPKHLIIISSILRIMTMLFPKILLKAFYIFVMRRSSR